MFSKDSNETRTMYSKSNNIQIMIGYEADEITEELFESFLQIYQEEGMKVNLFLIVFIHCITSLVK